MSGFVAVANMDGEPIDPLLMERLTTALAFRGPDAQAIMISDPVGLGHAQFHTKIDAPERQPCSLDGKVWITGDVRVDGRADFVRALRQSGAVRLEGASDPELVLHAYRAWGENLLDRLIGDFAFAIWNARDKRLFCARDQLGVKPFYFAQTGKQLIVSNTIACLRAHGAVPGTLNHAAVADFLLAGFNSDPSATMYEAIERLPEGHSLHWSPTGDYVVRRYWSLPRYDVPRLANPQEYADRFRSVLNMAVSDRLRSERVSVQMSGGLDSSLIAAVAQRLMRNKGVPAGIRAHTVVHDKLFNDPERHFAGLAAKSLAIPIQFLAADGFRLLASRHEPGGQFPEPDGSHSRPRLLDSLHGQIAQDGRVALTGWDGDAILQSSWSTHLATLVRNRRFGQLMAELAGYARVKRGLAKAVARRLRWSNANSDPVPTYPTWLNPDFERRLDLRARWARLHEDNQLPTAFGETARAPAYEVMAHPNWRGLFENFDPGATGFLIDYRHPLLDLRVLSCALSLPTIPWCVDKHMFRVVGQKLLPGAIVRRPKTALQGDPVPFAIREFLASTPQPFALHPQIDTFINVSSLSELIDDLRSSDYSKALRALILNQWLFNRE